jgi:hypothetical protein
MRTNVFHRRGEPLMSRHERGFKSKWSVTLCAATVFLVSFSVDCTARATIRIGLYGGSDDIASYVADRFSALNYDVQLLTLPAQVTANSLSNFDVLYVVSSEAGELSGAAPVIASWVAAGNGLIVEQPNVEGPVAIMPPGLSVSVFDRGYDGSSSGPNLAQVGLTSAGLVHPVTIGLTPEELSGNGDKVLLSGVSPTLTILGVQVTNPSLAAIAVGNYGAGRVIFHTGNINPFALRPGSDLYLRQMVNWASVPEPGSLALVVVEMAVLAICPRRRWRSRVGRS